MIIPSFIQEKQDYKECISFHGHTCMGVTIGYLAAKLALNWLDASRAEDEELITIVENDACCCDAIQLLTGCTFGKGNFIFKDYGKMAFTFGNRVTNRAIRIVLRDDVFTPPEEQIRLLERIRSGEADEQQVKLYEENEKRRSDELFMQGPEAFFHIEEIEFTPPPFATRAPSIPCSICKEMVMSTKCEDAGGVKVCRACFSQL